MIRTRTKIEAVLAVAFLLAISISSVFAVTRTISDTSDTVDTYIRNSNGKYWEATGANIQTAIWDLNSTHGGWVQLPAGNISISSEIKIKTSITLRGAGCGYYGLGNTTVTRLYKAASWNGYILNVTGASYSYPVWFVTISDLSIDGLSDTTLYGGIRLYRAMNTVIKNVNIANFRRTSSPYGQGINITDSSGYYSYLENIYCRGNVIGISIRSAANAGTINGGHINGGSIANARGLSFSHANSWLVMNTDFDGFDGSGSIALYLHGLSSDGGNNRFIGTRFEGNYDNIYIQSGGFNYFQDCLIAAASNTSVTDAAAYYKSSFKDCAIYFTENYGSETISAGTTSVVVNHGLSVTPNCIMLTPKSNLTSTTPKYNCFWYDTVTPTQFTIHIGWSCTGDVSFKWKAEYLPIVT